MEQPLLPCDGCGRPASAEHIGRRLKRLEELTRFRPIHVQALFLSAESPADPREYLYSSEGGFQGEAARLLEALGIETAARPAEAVRAEFQRRGFLLAHLLECPGEGGRPEKEALEGRFGPMLARIRRSFRPKKVALLGAEVAAFAAPLAAAGLETEIALAGGRPFEL